MPIVKFVQPYGSYPKGFKMETIKGAAQLWVARGIAEIVDDGSKVQPKKNSRAGSRTRKPKRSPRPVAGDE